VCTSAGGTLAHPNQEAGKQARGAAPNNSASSSSLAFFCPLRDALLIFWMEKLKNSLAVGSERISRSVASNLRASNLEDIAYYLHFKV
jgi:hypothetical protein